MEEVWSAQRGGQTWGLSTGPNESIQPANVGTLFPLARGTAQGQGQRVRPRGDVVQIQALPPPTCDLMTLA